MATRIKGSQIKGESVTGDQIQDDSLTGDDIDESTLVMTLDDVLSDGASSTVTMNVGNVIPSSDELYDLGGGSFKWNNIHTKDLNVNNQIIVSSSTANQELIRLQKGESDSRYMVFESDGVDKFEMFLNSFENFTFTTTETTDDILFRLNGHTAIYLDGYPKEIRLWDSYNSAYNTKINSTLDIAGETTAQNIVPETTNTHYLGASDGTNVWAGVYAGEVVAQSYKDIVFNITDGSSVDINPDNGGIQVWTLGANRSPTANNFDSGAKVMLMINDGSNYSITWPSVNWVGGVAPTLPTSGYGIIELWKVGTQLYGAFAGGVA